jgi:hypothetical protein
LFQEKREKRDLRVEIRDRCCSLVIRSYPVEFYVEVAIDAAHEIIRKEAERSWRSFLVVNRSHSSIRKETMIWSLNQMTFKKYSENEQFRQYLNGRMVNAAQQLVYKHVSKWFSVTNEFVLELMRASSIACIFLYDNPQLIQLPSSFKLQVLSLSNCKSLEQIGD